MPNKVEIFFEIDKDGKGKATIHGLDQQMKGLGNTAKQTGSDIDRFIARFQTAIVIEFFRRAAGEAYEFGKAAVQAFNEANNAALGLKTISKSAGIDPQAALEQVKNLDLVKNGLLTVGEASTALKNNLRTGFNLEQSIELIKRFGDIAAFNKQSAISFGDAVVRTTEGIRQNIATLADAGGLTTNPAAIQKKAGIEFDDLKDKINGAANATKYYKELLKETDPFVGDAALKANTFAGAQDKLAAQQKKLLETLGELITKNPELAKSFKSIGEAIEFITAKLKDPSSGLSKFTNESVSQLATLISWVSKLTKAVDVLAEARSRLIKGALLGIVGGVTGNSGANQDSNARSDAELKAANDKIIQDYKDAKNKAQADIVAALEAAPILEAEALKKKAEEDKKAFAEMKRDSDDYFRRQEADQKLIDDLAKKTADALREVGQATTDLQAKVSINPIGLMYDAALSKQAEFLEKFKRVPEEISAGYTKAAQDVARLDFFKGAFSQGLGLTNLLSENAKLQAGFGGADLKGKGLDDSLAFEERKLELIRAGVNVRDAGTRAELERQALLFELESKRAGGTLSSAEQAILLKKIDLTAQKFASESKLDAFKSGAIDEQIRIAQQFLAQADSAAQKQFANQQIIGLTGDIGKLTPSQIEARQKALTDEITLGQTAFKENFERLSANTAAMQSLDKNITKLAERESFVKIIVDNALNARIDRLPDNN